MGVPFDSGTFNRPGTRYGPRAIREQSSYAAAFDPIYPWNRKLADACRIVDFGDVASLPGTGVTESMLQATEAVAAEILQAGASLLTLGGVINHGTFATGLAKEGCIDLPRSSQLYIRTFLPETPGGGYTIVYANEALEMGPEKLAEQVKGRVGDAPVYLSLDIDAVDSASAPGTGSPVPGGPTTGDFFVSDTCVEVTVTGQQDVTGADITFDAKCP